MSSTVSHIFMFLCRPLNAAEKARGSFSIMDTNDHTVTIKERPQDKITKNFTFDRVFGPKSKQVSSGM